VRERLLFFKTTHNASKIKVKHEYFTGASDQWNRFLVGDEMEGQQDIHFVVPRLLRRHGDGVPPHVGEARYDDQDPLDGAPLGEVPLDDQAPLDDEVVRHQFCLGSGDIEVVPYPVQAVRKQDQFVLVTTTTTLSHKAATTCHRRHKVVATTTEEVGRAMMCEEVGRAVIGRVVTTVKVGRAVIVTTTTPREQLLFLLLFQLFMPLLLRWQQ
jgi:septal ring-binding cell division protein DamX